MPFGFRDSDAIGASIGSGFGSGLARSLELLAQDKFDQLKRLQQQQRTSRGLSALFPQEKSSALAELDPFILREIIKQELPRMRDQEVNKIIENIISSYDPEFDNNTTIQPQSIQKQKNKEIVDNDLLKTDSNIITEIKQQAPDEIMPSSRFKSSATQILSPGAQAAREIEKLEEKIQKSSLSTDQKSLLRKRIEDRQNFLDKKQDIIDKKTAPFYDKINADYEAAQSGNIRLERMKELINSGNIDDPTFASILGTLENVIPSFGVGINLKGAFLSPESQEFEKLSKDFLRDVKKIFGNRITNNEINQFLKTIPTLSQSDAGKLRIINNIQLFNEASQIKKEAADTIIAENYGFRPANFESLVEKITKEPLRKIADEFKSGSRLKNLESDIQRAEKRDIGSTIAPIIGAGIGGIAGGSSLGLPGALLLGTAGAAGASKIRKDLSNLLSQLEMPEIPNTPQMKDIIGFLLQKSGGPLN